MSRAPLLALLAAFAAAPASAVELRYPPWIPGAVVVAETVPQRVRGTVLRLEGAVLVVQTREGTQERVLMLPNWTVSGVERSALDAIKPGGFVGAAAVPGEGGRLRAVEVLVFPAGQRGGEGHSPWDLLPESTMTNATVASSVAGVSGTTLELAYPGGAKTIVVPPEAPIVTFVPATPAEVVAGAKVFIPARRAADGALSSGRVLVGRGGLTPPM